MDGRERVSQRQHHPLYVTSAAALMQFSFASPSCPDLQRTYQVRGVGEGGAGRGGNECKLSISAGGETPQIIDNILCFAKIDLIDCGTNLVLHVLREICHGEAT